MEFPLQIAIALVIGVICLVIGHQINQKKNRPISEAWFACMLLGPIGLLMIAFAPKRKPNLRVEEKYRRLAPQHPTILPASSPADPPIGRAKKKPSPVQIVGGVVFIVICLGLLIKSVLDWRRNEERLAAISQPASLSPPTSSPNNKQRVNKLERNNIQLMYSDSVKQEVAEKVLQGLENNKNWKILVEDLEWGKKEPGVVSVNCLAATYELTMAVSSADNKKLLDDEFGFKLGVIMFVHEVFPGSTVKFQLYNRQLLSVWTLEIPPE